MEEKVYFLINLANYEDYLFVKLNQFEKRKHYTLQSTICNFINL